MPDTPDFDELARRFASAFDVEIHLVAEQLRQFWNARGAADVAKIAAAFDGQQPSLEALHQALRSLDR
jgi:hypothetical protein